MPILAGEQAQGHEFMCLQAQRREFILTVLLTGFLSPGHGHVGHRRQQEVEEENARERAAAAAGMGGGGGGGGGARGGMPGMPPGMDQLFSDPDIMAAMQNPKVWRLRPVTLAQ